MDDIRTDGPAPRTAESSTSTSGARFAFVKSGSGVYDQQRHNGTGIHTPSDSTSSSTRDTAFAALNSYVHPDSTARPSQADSIIPHHRLAPPPLAPYVRPEDRFIAPHPENYRTLTPRPNNPSIPPPQRPAPSWIPAPPVRPKAQSQAPPSPPSSRGQHALSPSTRRSQSGSAHSSPRPGDDTGMENNREGEERKSEKRHAALDEAGKGGGCDERNKRTRVLMTHLQQQNLSKLWKATKFPNTQEREEVASEVGLTARQVQVWFQNRRQTNRKHIKDRTVPEDADPRDYSDLQQSPATRRSSLLSEERTSSWASSMGSTAGPSSTTATREDHGSRASLPSLASLTELYSEEYNRDIPHFRPQTSDSYNSTSSSRHLPRITHLTGLSSPSRRNTELWESSSRPHDPYPSRPHTSSFQTLRPPMMSNSGSTDSSASFNSSSNPYSPPPTADAQRFQPNPPAPHSYTAQMTSGQHHPTTMVEEPRRPSSLPPSLAALVITRPLSREVAREEGGVTLPGIGSIRSGVGTMSSPGRGEGRPAHHRAILSSALGLIIPDEGVVEDQRERPDLLPPMRRFGESFR